MALGKDFERRSSVPKEIAAEEKFWPKEKNHIVEGESAVGVAYSPFRTRPPPSSHHTTTHNVALQFDSTVHSASMPEYLAAKAAVSLMVTDLLPVPEPNATAGNHLLREDLHVDSLQPASREIKQYQRGEVRKATETFFKGHDGVEFLGTDMPFYLVNAGLDLFRSRLTPNSGNVGHHAGASDVGPDSSLSIIPSSRCHSPIKPSEDGNGVRGKQFLHQVVLLEAV